MDFAEKMKTKAKDAFASALLSSQQHQQQINDSHQLQHVVLEMQPPVLSPPSPLINSTTLPDSPHPPLKTPSPPPPPPPPPPLRKTQQHHHHHRQQQQQQQQQAKYAKQKQQVKHKQKLLYLNQIKVHQEEAHARMMIHSKIAQHMSQRNRQFGLLAAVIGAIITSLGFTDSAANKSTTIVIPIAIWKIVQIVLGIMITGINSWLVQAKYMDISNSHKIAVNEWSNYTFLLAQAAFEIIDLDDEASIAPNKLFSINERNNAMNNTNNNNAMNINIDMNYDGASEFDLDELSPQRHQQEQRHQQYMRMFEQQKYQQEIDDFHDNISQTMLDLLKMRTELISRLPELPPAELNKTVLQRTMNMSDNLAFDAEEKMLTFLAELVVGAGQQHQPIQHTYSTSNSSPKRQNSFNGMMSSSSSSSPSTQATNVTSDHHQQHHKHHLLSRRFSSGFKNKDYVNDFMSHFKSSSNINNSGKHSNSLI